MVEPFPPIQRAMLRRGGEDRNPAVQLFGRRFFADQTVPELLVELLLVASSAKKIGGSLLDSSQVFPNLELLNAWPNSVHLEYAPKARLNLKLFAFLGASKLETRHESHREQYRKLLSLLKSPHNLEFSGTTDSTEVLRTLENLFLGFQGIGGNRTWCAQAFVPLSRAVLCAETLWNETQARNDNVRHWGDVADRFSHFFSLSRHRFLSRGGELLYLQLCNSLRQDENDIKAWCTKNDFSFSRRELNPKQLHKTLGASINSILNACPDTISKLAEFIDAVAEPETAERTDNETTGEPRFTSCGWCPTESWPEGLLFAVELVRLCDAVIDPIHRLELLEIACAVQALRSLCAQSARFVAWKDSQRKNAGPLKYVWAISDPEGENTALKQISRRCVKANQRMIYEAVRHPDILEIVKQQRQIDEADGRPWKHPMAPYMGANGADSRYGHKLFLTLSKRIGLVIPKRGAGARFVLNDKLLRFLVMTVIRPGERITYETFKNLVYAHYGIALDDQMIGQACVWCGTGQLSSLGGNSDAWVLRMLDAAGVLIRLSDAYSMVTNPFNGGEE